LQQKIEELERKINSSPQAAPTADPRGDNPSSTVVNINDGAEKAVKCDDASEEPKKSSSPFCTLWGGPIMPSEDQNLW
jgi:hypothetical protein